MRFLSNKFTQKCQMYLGTGPITRATLNSDTNSSDPTHAVIPPPTFREDRVPKNSDIVIVGGGIMGWATAFWLRWYSKLSVTVIERDPTYNNSATYLGLGSIRQQFSEPEHIQMSLFGSEFLRNIKHYLTPYDNAVLDVEFNPQGCLLLANEEQAEKLEESYRIQIDLGARVQLLTKTSIEQRWPWLNVRDIELGTFGYENEGWFDPWLLLRFLRAKCHTMGVNYVVGEVIDFKPGDYTLTVALADMPLRAPVHGKRLREAVIRLADNSTATIIFSSVVNAAGPWAADVAKLAEIGTEQLPVPLPIEPRARQIYVVKPNTEQGRSSCIPSLDTPFIIDPNRLFIERRGLSGEFFVYSNDTKFDLPLSSNKRDEIFKSDIDYTMFKQDMCNLLSQRIPSMTNATITSSWTAISDFNNWDQNLIVGRHPFHVNMYFCNGCTGHGTQHSIAIGRAISELIFFGHYKTVDLTRFSFDRLCLNETVGEAYSF